MAKSQESLQTLPWLGFGLDTSSPLHDCRNTNLDATNDDLPQGLNKHSRTVNSPKYVGFFARQRERLKTCLLQKGFSVKFTSNEQSWNISAAEGGFLSAL